MTVVGLLLVSCFKWMHLRDVCLHFGGDNNNLVAIVCILQLLASNSVFGRLGLQQSVLGAKTSNGALLDWGYLGKRGGMDGYFIGLTGLHRGISKGKNKLSGYLGNCSVHQYAYWVANSNIALIHRFIEAFLSNIVLMMGRGLNPIRFLDVYVLPLKEQ